MIRDECLSIVIVDDDDMFREILTSQLEAKSQFVLHQAASGDELVAILSGRAVDCIVLDYDLGNENGFGARQRASEKFRTLPPIVMLTGDGRESTVIKALRTGVSDYLPKRTSKPDDVIASITAAVERSRKEAAATAERERLTAAAGIDVVTGLLGKPNLEERLTQLAELSERLRANYGIILLELTELAEITFQFGLTAADRALREVAKRLKEAVRSDDICGRYGMHTFLVVANIEGDPEQLGWLCARLATAVTMRIEYDKYGVALSPRIGSALCKTVHDGSRDYTIVLLEAAQASLAGAKRANLADAAEAAPIQAPAAAMPPTGRPPIDSDRLDEFVDPPPKGRPSRPAADELRTSDRRREPRQRIFKRGQILFTGNAATIDCAVRNISEGGAGLRTGAVFAVPDEFDLLIFGGGSRRRVRKRWQVGVNLGVEYV